MLILFYQASVIRRSMMLEIIPEDFYASFDLQNPTPIPRANNSCTRTFEVTYSRTDVGWHAHSHIFLSFLSIGLVGIVISVLFVWILIHHSGEIGTTNLLNPVVLLARTPLDWETSRLVDMENTPTPSTTLRFQRTRPVGRDWAGGYVLSDQNKEPSRAKQDGYSRTSAALDVNYELVAFQPED